MRRSAATLQSLVGELALEKQLELGDGQKLLEWSILQSASILEEMV
jgi:hypothetical protein